MSDFGVRGMLGRKAALAAALAGALTLGGCDTTEQVVDAMNPVSWFEDDPNDLPEAENTEPRPVPGADGDYPNIGEVPDRPAEPGIRREYMALAEVLAADRENALYTDEQIRRQSPPSRRSAPPQPVGADPASLDTPPPEPPTASSITPPPEAPSTLTAEQGAAAQSATAAQPSPQPAPQPSTQAAPQPAPAPAPAPEPLTAGSTAQAPTPAEAPPPSPAPVTQQVPGQGASQTAAAGAAAVPTRTQMIATIYFPSGGAGLTERDRGILSQVAEIYRRDGGKRVVIVGHSSRAGASGSESQRALVNYKVSLDRAAAVGQTLVGYGIPVEQIVVDARGAQELKYAEDTAAGEAGNRRAEIFLQY